MLSWVVFVIQSKYFYHFISIILVMPSAKFRFRNEVLVSLNLEKQDLGARVSSALGETWELLMLNRTARGNFWLLSLPSQYSIRWVPDPPFSNTAARTAEEAHSIVAFSNSLRGKSQLCDCFCWPALTSAKTLSWWQGLEECLAERQAIGCDELEAKPSLLSSSSPLSSLKFLSLLAYLLRCKKKNISSTVIVVSTEGRQSNPLQWMIAIRVSFLPEVNPWIPALARARSCLSSRQHLLPVALRDSIPPKIPRQVSWSRTKSY